MYVSPIDPTIPHLDDSNIQHWVKPTIINDDGQEQSATGYIPRDYDKQPLGSITATSAFPSHLILDDQQIKERIEQLERTGTDLVSLLKAACDAKKFICLNQNPTNYCWCYAVTHAVMIARFLANEPFVRLSPYSVACIVKNFQNNGGWGGEANEQMVKEGVADEKYWPMEQPGMPNRSEANMNAIRNGRQYLQSSRENAGFHKATEFWELQPSNAREKLSCLCIPLPVASGYNAIGHERCTIKATVLSNGKFGGIDLDSYTNDGSLDLKSYSIDSLRANDAVCPRVISPSNV